MAEAWSAKEHKLLEDAIRKYPASMEKKERWAAISAAVPGRTAKACVERVRFVSAALSAAKSTHAGGDTTAVKAEVESKAAAEKAAAEKESADKPAATEETAAPLAVEPTQAAAQPTEQHAAETVAQQLAELPARAAAEQASPQRTGPTEQTSKRPRSESPAPDGERPASAQQHEEEVKRQQCSASSAACSAEVCS
jgi:hypothetical protein